MNNLLERTIVKTFGLVIAPQAKGILGIHAAPFSINKSYVMTFSYLDTLFPHIAA